MVDFGGWSMPQQYLSVRDEHLAVRRAAGLFDISHMGRLDVRGPRTAEYLGSLLTNAVEAVAPNRAQYALMCDERGGIIDDLVVYRRAEDRYLVVVNASTRAADVAWMRDHLRSGVEIEDVSETLGLVALQGPLAQAVLPAEALDLDGIPYFGFASGMVAGIPAIVSRTGYTGEDGFEVFLAAERVGDAWDAILEAGASRGVLPAGLAARDVCRLEAGLRLYGQDMDLSTNPYEAGLGWTVKLDGREFIGAGALRRIKAEGAARQVVGLACAGRVIPRHGAAVTAGGEEIGSVTSGTHSFFLEHGIGMAMVERGRVRPGDPVELALRAGPAPARVVELPFIRGSARTAAAAHVAGR